MRARLLTLASLLLLALPCVAVKYRVVDLGATLGPSRAWAVNDFCLVVGGAELPFTYSESAGASFAGPRFYARQPGTFYAINGSGEAAGSDFWLVNGRLKVDQPCYWSPKTGFVQIPFLPQTSQGFGYGINAMGTVVGRMIGGVAEEAFVWDKTRGTRAMGHFDPRYGSMATGINNLDEACGTAGNAQGLAHAFRWTSATGLVDLGTLAGYYESFGEAINDQGEIVGTCFRSGSEVTFRMKRGQAMEFALPGFPGFVHPFRINSQGWFCGTALSVMGQFAAVCPPDGSVIDVAANAEGGTAGLTLIQATGINERGDVCGIGLTPSNETHAFLAVRVQ